MVQEEKFEIKPIDIQASDSISPLNKDYRKRKNCEEEDGGEVEEEEEEELKCEIKQENNDSL